MTEVEDLRKLKDELMKYEPSEIICNEAFLVSGYDVEDLKSRLHMSVSSLESHMFDDDGCRRILMRHFKVNTLIGLGVEEFPTGILAAGALLQYLYDTQKTDLEHFVGQFHQKKSGTDRDTAGKAEERVSVVGTGQDEDGHGRQIAAKLY